MYKKTITALPPTSIICSASLFASECDMGKYKDSLNNFEKTLVSRESNLDFARLAAICKDYDQSIVAYERALINNPLDVEANSELASLYNTLGRSDEARELLKSIDKETKPYKDVKKGLKKHYFEAYAGITIGRDSNVKNDIGEKTYTAGAYANLQGNKEKADNFSVLSAGIDSNYVLTDDKKLIIRTGLDVYSQNYLSETNSNLAYIGLRSGPAYQSTFNPFDKYYVAVEAPLVYERVFSGNADYLNAYGVMPHLLYKNKYLSYDTSLTLKNNAYLKNNEALDSYFVDYKNQISVPLWYGFEVTGAYSLQKSLKKRDSRTDVAYFGKKADLIVSYAFSNMAVFAANTYAEKKYSDTDLIYLNRRHDRNLAKTVGFVYAGKHNDTIRLTVSSVDNFSNQPNNEYKKTSVALAYMVRFSEK